MSAAIIILIRVAEELAELAKNSIPKIRNGEKICREWLKDGVYCRESLFNGKTFLAQFDFKTCTSSFIQT